MSAGTAPTCVGELPEAESVVFFHAHPDDETLSGGALLAAMVAAGRRVAVVTATRGERGEVRAGVEIGSDLAGHRVKERDAALAALGVETGAWLGKARRYTDSGMRWIAPGVAGPDQDAPPDCLSRADLGQASADLTDFVREFGAEALISYDAEGGYHHPDHVACHHIAKRAAAATELARYELVSEGIARPAGAQWLDHPDQRPKLLAALRCYASQFSVEGAEIVHVGGQRQLVQTGVWLFRTR